MRRPPSTPKRSANPAGLPNARRGKPKELAFSVARIEKPQRKARRQREISSFWPQPKVHSHPDIDQRTWDKVRAVMAEPAHRRGVASRAQVPALPKGLIFGPNGRPMSPSHARRRGRIYRYYVARRLSTSRPQRLTQLHRLTRVSSAFAASHSKARAALSPHLVDVTGVVGLARSVLGRRQPELGADRGELGKRSGSSTAVLNASAVSAPTPGTVISRRHTWSCLTTASTPRPRSR
jgi:hypothetical protein